MLWAGFLCAAPLRAAFAPENGARAAGIDNAGEMHAYRWFSPAYPFLPDEAVYVKPVFVRFLSSLPPAVYEESLVTAIKAYDWSDLRVARRLVDDLLFRYDWLGISLLTYYRESPTDLLILYKFYLRIDNELENAPGKRFCAFKLFVNEIPELIRGMDYSKYTSAGKFNVPACMAIMCLRHGWERVEKNARADFDAIWQTLLSLNIDRRAKYILIEDVAVTLYHMNLREWLYSRAVLPEMFQLAVDLGKLPEVAFLRDERYAQDADFCARLVQALAGVVSANGVQLMDFLSDSAIRWEYNTILSEFCYKHRKQLLSRADAVACALHYHYNHNSAPYTSLDDLMRSAQADTFKDMPQQLLYLLYFLKLRQSQYSDKHLLVRFSVCIRTKFLASVLCYAGMEYDRTDHRTEFLTEFVKSMDSMSRQQLLEEVRHENFSEVCVSSRVVIWTPAMFKMLRLLKKILKKIRRR
ncbi:hypothetical protein PAPHI01_0257 [Pancytospora philotis]|nr:hypothetical protein PAPHI01_0257 [Pancytospora philotis]